MSLSTGSDRWKNLRPSRSTRWRDSKSWRHDTGFCVDTFSMTCVCVISFAWTLLCSQTRGLRRSHFSIVLVLWNVWNRRQVSWDTGSHDRNVCLWIFGKASFFRPTRSLFDIFIDQIFEFLRRSKIKNDSSISMSRSICNTSQLCLRTSMRSKSFIMDHVHMQSALSELARVIRLNVYVETTIRSNFLDEKLETTVKNLETISQRSYKFSRFQNHVSLSRTWDWVCPVFQGSVHQSSFVWQYPDWRAHRDSSVLQCVTSLFTSSYFSPQLKSAHGYWR